MTAAEPPTQPQRPHPPDEDETQVAPAGALTRPGFGRPARAPSAPTPPAFAPPATPSPVAATAGAAGAAGSMQPPTPSPPWPSDADDDATQVRPGALAELPAATAAGVAGAAALAAHATSHPTGADGPSLPKTAAAGTLPGRTITGLGARALPQPGLDGDGAIRQVGRYRVLSRLGRGGMASVWRAHDPQIGRDVAIKFLHASLAEDEECRGRFLREARAAGGLAHPNIVVVHDVGEIEGRPYMAMELIDGAPLSEMLEPHRQLPIRDAVVIGVQLARALDYAHQRGVVHRDIKPGNIMVMRDGRSVKVADFGIAHMDDGAALQRTQVGAVLGTPQYMSPEQTRGEKLDGRSDLFSAGIVLYQMVAGERPFRGDSLVAVATRIAGEAPPPLAAARPDAPASLRRVIDRCLAKSPAQRFPSGREMADALIKVLAEIDESARERERAKIVPLRVKWALSMAAIVALVMGVTAAVITQRQYEALVGQAAGYGASLARFIARQHAPSALLDEWEVVDVAVQEMMKTGTFERIVMVDKAGTVRAASRPEWVGKPYRAPPAEALGRLAGDSGAVRFQAGDDSILGFEAPITFQDQVAGRVALGLPERPLTQVARLSITLMSVLALVTVLAVAVAMYVLANWFAKPIRLVGEALGEVARGNLTHRIGEPRKDEFGQLFADFDAMAQALQQREEQGLLPAGGGSSPATPPAAGAGTTAPATVASTAASPSTGVTGMGPAAPASRAAPAASPSPASPASPQPPEDPR